MSHCGSVANYWHGSVHLGVLPNYIYIVMLLELEVSPKGASWELKIWLKFETYRTHSCLLTWGVLNSLFLHYIHFILNVGEEMQ